MFGNGKHIKIFRVKIIPNDPYLAPNPLLSSHQDSRALSRPLGHTCTVGAGSLSSWDGVSSEV